MSDFLLLGLLKDIELECVSLDRRTRYRGDPSFHAVKYFE